jgi:hypothetical protein
MFIENPDYVEITGLGVMFHLDKCLKIKKIE